MDVLFGLIGVLAGVAIGSGYSFWAVRRSELQRALIAGTIVSDELGALADGIEAKATGKPSSGDADRAVAAWQDHRASLVVYMPLSDFQKVGASIRKAKAWAPGSDPAQPVACLRNTKSTILEHTSKVRKEHEEFILVPLMRFLRNLFSRK